MKRSNKIHFDKLALVQFIAFKIYRAIDISGLFKNARIDDLFLKLYYIYKDKLEAVKPNELKPFVPKNGVVIDIGAAMGYYTVQLAEYLNSMGKVFALEPESINFSRLERMIDKKNLTGKVVLMNYAASAISGEVFLSIDKNNPANHKIGENGVKTRAISIDDLGKNFVRCDFIKIDVQGFEAEVLKGARETILRFFPTILLEIDNTANTQTTSDVLEFFSTLNVTHYSYWTISNGISPISKKEILQKKGYFDLLLTNNSSEIKNS